MLDIHPKYIYYSKYQLMSFFRISGQLHIVPNLRVFLTFGMPIIRRLASHALRMCFFPTTWSCRGRMDFKGPEPSQTKHWNTACLPPCLLFFKQNSLGILLFLCWKL